MRSTNCTVPRPRRWANHSRSGTFFIDRQPGVVLLQLPRTEPGRRHDVFVLAHGDPPGVREPENRSCEVAIAGGVNVSMHPNKYLALSQGQFASSVGSLRELR